MADIAKIIKGIADAIGAARQSFEPDPWPTIQATAVAVGEIAERVGELEEREAVARQFCSLVSSWLEDLNRDHPCTGPGCWWCEQRTTLGRMVLEAEPPKPTRKRARAKRAKR